MLFFRLVECQRLQGTQICEQQTFFAELYIVLSCLISPHYFQVSGEYLGKSLDRRCRKGREADTSVENGDQDWRCLGFSLWTKGHVEDESAVHRGRR